MGDDSEHTREQVWRADMRAFVKTAASHYKEIAGGFVVMLLTAIGAHLAFAVPQWAASTCLVCGSAVMAAFLAFRDQRRIAETAHEMLADEKQRRAKPNIQIEVKTDEAKLFHGSGEKIGTWEIITEHLLIAVTNIGGSVSVSHIDFMIQGENGEDRILTPTPPVPTLPQLLETNHSFHPQEYRFAPGQRANVMKMNPRVIVRASDGYVTMVGREAFSLVRPFYGGGPRALC